MPVMQRDGQLSSYAKMITRRLFARQVGRAVVSDAVCNRTFRLCMWTRNERHLILRSSGPVLVCSQVSSNTCEAKTRGSLMPNRCVKDGDAVHSSDRRLDARRIHRKTQRIRLCTAGGAVKSSRTRRVWSLVRTDTIRSPRPSRWLATLIRGPVLPRMGYVRYRITRRR